MGDSRVVVYDTRQRIFSVISYDREWHRISRRGAGGAASALEARPLAGARCYSPPRAPPSSRVHGATRNARAAPLRPGRHPNNVSVFDKLNRRSRKKYRIQFTLYNQSHILSECYAVCTEKTLSKILKNLV